MERFQILPFTFAIVLTGTTGCLAPRRDAGEYLSSHRVSIADPSAEADRVWEAVLDTLRHHRFRLDRTDRRAGIITTMPATSQHFFEFWRHDVATREDFWEATLNPLRRWAEVTVSRGDDGGWTKLSVVVHTERFSSYDRQFNSTGAAYEFFGDVFPTTTGLAPDQAPDDRWLPLGTDPAMGEYLLNAIRKRAGL